MAFHNNKEKYSIDIGIKTWNHFYTCVKNHDIFIIIAGYLMRPATVVGQTSGPEAMWPTADALGFLPHLETPASPHLCSLPRAHKCKGKAQWV